VMTDKALVEITAPEAGRVTRLYVQKGEIAKVHAPLFGYVAEGEADAGQPAAVPAATPDDTGAAAQAPRSTVDQAPSRERRAPAASEEAPEEERAEPGRGPYGRIPVAPAVRRLLREHDLDLEVVPGSGRQGRVLKEDVLRYLEDDERAAEGAAAADAGSRQEIRVEPLRGVRAVMARRMVEAASTIPHFQYGEEIDVTELLALRERLKPRAEAQGTRLTLMPFFMKAMALAVREAPILNARLSDDESEIHYLASVNVGMAVDSRAGLLVPNVKGVERRSLLSLAEEVGRLTEAARAGKVSQADLKGGTISISNIGALGGTYAAPIINAPEVAIVAIGKTQWLPRFDAEERVVKRAIMTVTWVGDHRIIDGGTIARFCNAWKGYLEDPETMLLHLA